jgi:Tfp pilus assembly protein PilO
MAQTLDDERTTLLSLIDHREAIESGYAAMEGAIAIGTSVEELQLNFVRDVETIARREGLRVANIRPLGHSAEAPFHRLAVQVTTEGEHHQFVRFLQAMQRPDTLLRGDTITVVASRRTPPLSITLRISKLVRVHG